MTNSYYNIINDYAITHVIAQKDKNLYKYINNNSNNFELLYEDEYFCIYEVI